MNNIREDEFKLLWKFFAGYFHQDWDLDSNTSDEVVQLFMRDASRDEIERLRAAILRLSECDCDNAELEKSLLRDYGCFYTPSGGGETVKEWLQSIISILSTRSD
jgi:hypothetical protein